MSISTQSWHPFPQQFPFKESEDPAGVVGVWESNRTQFLRWLSALGSSSESSRTERPANIYIAASTPLILQVRALHCRSPTPTAPQHAPPRRRSKRRRHLCANKPHQANAANLQDPFSFQSFCDIFVYGVSVGVFDKKNNWIRPSNWGKIEAKSCCLKSKSN